MHTLILPSSLLRFSHGISTIQIEGASLREVLDSFKSRFPELSPILFSRSGNLQVYVSLFVNQSQVSAEAGDEPLDLPSPSTIEIMMAVAGG